MTRTTSRAVVNGVERIYGWIMGGRLSTGDSGTTAGWHGTRGFGIGTRLTCTRAGALRGTCGSGGRGTRGLDPVNDELVEVRHGSRG